jgi:hypothetical protein
MTRIILVLIPLAGIVCPAAYFVFTRQSRPRRPVQAIALSIALVQIGISAAALISAPDAGRLDDAWVGVVGLGVISTFSSLAVIGLGELFLEWSGGRRSGSRPLSIQNPSGGVPK